MATDEEVLASVKRGKPPVDCAVIGTWKLRSYVRERLSDGQRRNQFGEAPVGYIGYAPDGRMYAIFTPACNLHVNSHFECSQAEGLPASFLCFKPC